MTDAGELAKKTEELLHKLQASEIKFRRLFEAAQDGILLMNPETEKIIDANPFLLNLLGYSIEEVVGKELWEIGVFKDINASKEAFDKLKKEKYIRYEDLPLQNKNGERKDVEFVSNLYPINSVSMIQCNIRDITDRKVAENKARIYKEGLEKMNKFMNGREVRMADLKEEIKKLKEELVKADQDLLLSRESPK